MQFWIEFGLLDYCLCKFEHEWLRPVNRLSRAVWLVRIQTHRCIPSGHFSRNYEQLLGLFTFLRQHNVKMFGKRIRMELFTWNFRCHKTRSLALKHWHGWKFYGYFEVFGMKFGKSYITNLLELNQLKEWKIVRNSFNGFI